MFPNGVGLSESTERDVDDAAVQPRLDADRRRLVEEHVHLVEHVVRSVAQRFPAHVDRSDLVSAGMLGLVQAAAAFSADRSVPFGAYATIRIRGAVLDFARRADWVPRRRRQQLRDQHEADSSCALGEDRWSRQLGLAAGSVGFTGAELRAVRDQTASSLVRSLVSTSSYEVADSLERLADPLAPEVGEEIERSELLDYLRAALHLLPERHRLVLVGLYFEDKGFAELAKLLGVSPSRVSQLRSEAVDMVREAIEAPYQDPLLSSPPGLDDRAHTGSDWRRRHAATMAARLTDRAAWQRSAGRQPSRRQDVAWNRPGARTWRRTVAAVSQP